MISRRLLIVNAILAIALVWGGLKVSASWKDFDRNHQPRLVEAQPESIGAPVAEKPVADPAIGEWFEASGKNPFSFDRNDVNLVVEVAAPQVNMPPKPVLFGVLDLGKGLVAMLGDPGARRSSPPAVKAGDTFRGWKVVEVRKKAVVVSANGVEESLELGNAPVDRDSGKTAGAAPAAMTPSQAGVLAPSSTPSSSTPAPAALPGISPGPVPGTRTVYTPFGIQTERDR